MHEVLQRVFQPQVLVNRYYQSGWENADQLLNRPEATTLASADLIQEISFVHSLRDRVNQGIDSAYTTGKLAVLTPVGLFGLSEGFALPDWDISTLGIGYHRFFLFHSAIGLAVLQHFHKHWQNRLSEQQPGWGGRMKQKVAGTLLGTGAIGVGLHLLVDVFQPKSVVFPFFGSLVSGTLVDDNLWLLGNSLWAFKIGHDVFSLVLADEMNVARNYVNIQFGGLSGWRPNNKSS